MAAENEMKTPMVQCIDNAEWEAKSKDFTR